MQVTFKDQVNVWNLELESENENVFENVLTDIITKVGIEFKNSEIELKYNNESRSYSHNKSPLKEFALVLQKIEAGQGKLPLSSRAQLLAYGLAINAAIVKNYDASLLCIQEMYNELMHSKNGFEIKKSFSEFNEICYFNKSHAHDSESIQNLKLNRKFFYEECQYEEKIQHLKNAFELRKFFPIFVQSFKNEGQFRRFPREMIQEILLNAFQSYYPN
ncbi:MAG: hypothetical protein LW832_10440 [Parachlamydia sp.]|jgi:hypothetical protein|nr:hypothetical protein [Parachlamydia sp.]